MQALWADGWFYISSAGLLVSGALFFFLLGQYRAAADAVDVRETPPEAEVEARAVPVRPVYVPEEPAPAPKLASVSAPAERTEPKPAASTSRESTTGGISPAVVYLQNIQTHLYELHGEIRDLGQRVNAITSRDEALIERLGELAQAVAEIKAVSAPAVVAEAPAPKRARKPEPAAAPKPEPVVEAKPEPVAEPKPEPIVEAKPAPAVEIKPEPIVETKPEPVVEARKTASPDATIRLEPGAAVESDERPRRGPVWPV